MKRTCLFHVSGNRYAPFPSQHHTLRIWEELAKGFDEYHVIARGLENRYLHCINGKIHLHLLPSCGKRMWPFFFVSWLLPLFVLRYRPTHLLAQCPVLGGLSAAFCAKLFRIPLFVEFHGTHYFASARAGWKGIVEFNLYRFFSRLTLRAACRIRSLSIDMSDHLQRVYGENLSPKVIVIPNRVDLATFRFIKLDYAIDAPIKVITVGNFYENKNHRALIEDLYKSGVNFRLTLIGAGSLQDEYINIAERLQVRDKVEIRYLDHQLLAELLPQHDIYVHYSLAEGVSRAILEAMASGLPVVTTRVGFIRGVLCDSENAVVIDKPYAEGLIAAIRSLADSEQLRCKLGVAARRTIEERFEWNLVFEQYRTAILTMN